MLIAKKLGPVFLAAWGFILLVIQFFNQLDFGVPRSLNVILSMHKKRLWYSRKILGASLFLITLLVIITLFIFGINEIFSLDLGRKYRFSDYAPMVALICSLNYFNLIFLYLFRIYGKLIEIWINQSTPAIFIFLSLLVFEGEALLRALVISFFLATLTSFFVFLLRIPIRFRPNYSSRLIKTLSIKGWYLFLGNSSIYFILISCRWLTSARYTAEEFGYFTFAISMSNVILLSLTSFSYLLFPKLLNSLAKLPDNRVLKFLQELRIPYLFVANLLGHISILLFPFLIAYFPQYYPSVDIFKVSVLAVVLFSSSFGYSALLTARKQEKVLSRISLVSLVFSIVITIALLQVWDVDIKYILAGLIVPYLFYSFLLAKKLQNVLRLDPACKIRFNQIIPLEMLLPCALSFVLIVLAADSLWYVSPIILAVVLGWKSLKVTKEKLNYILRKPDLIDI
ncbi:hypothetical protein N9Y63_02290 [Akkermansiaceae bacterium]|nr:hypothetical protein [Akkermansiaceae bacterium]